MNEAPEEVVELENGTKLRELVAKYGEGIKGFQFDKEKVYLLLGDSAKIDHQQLLWVGRALDKAGIWVIIGMIEPDALRVVEMHKPEGSKQIGEKLIMTPSEWKGGRDV